MILLGERSLRRALCEYRTHYLPERYHQGVNHQLLEPSNAATFTTGPIQRRDRPGGMLSYYHREAARVSRLDIWTLQPGCLTRWSSNGRKAELIATIEEKMSLNIKSAEADRLVEALSNLTGESKTQAVIEALRERLERERRERDRTALSVELLAIGKRCAGYGRHDTTDHGEFLYDERGLPR